MNTLEKTRTPSVPVVMAIMGLIYGIVKMNKDGLSLLDNSVPFIAGTLGSTLGFMIFIPMIPLIISGIVYLFSKSFPHNLFRGLTFIIASLFMIIQFAMFLGFKGE